MSPSVQIPTVGSLIRTGLPAVVEGTLIPLAIFYAALGAFGMWGALISAVAWTYLSLVRRAVRREPIPGMVLLGALALTFRTALSMFTGSLIIYFLQPSLGTALIGLAFLFSAASRQPLIQRLVRDFLPAPSEFFDQPTVRRFFKRISPVWAVMMVANAVITGLMLFSIPIELFLVARTVVSGAIIGATMAYSVVGLRRLLAGPAVVTSGRLRQDRRPTPSIPGPVHRWGLTPQFAFR